MDAARYQRLKRLLFDASQRPANARSAFLDEECADDPKLRIEVEALLGGAKVATQELQRPVDEAVRGTTELPDPPWECGPYRIEQEIGRGGMGIVYEARDTRDDRRVAVKFVPPLFASAPAFNRRFEREADMGRKVAHHNVVRTLDFGSYDRAGGPLPYLVMEFVEGENLRDLLTELGTVPETLLREIAMQVSDGLAAIHDTGIVHRDLKPENVLLTADRRVRITDLGVAKLRDATIELTGEGQFIGSLPYAAPEQCDASDVGPPADLYALGVVLYELATGTNPFRRENPAASIHAHLDFTPPPATDYNQDISPFFNELLATLLAKKPDDRFPSAQALRAVLEAGERSPWWMGRETRAGGRLRPRASVRRETRVYGRDTELETLRTAWHEARAGRGSVMLIEGEAGVGKSRLVDALLEQADPTDAHLLYGAYLPGGALLGFCDAVLGRFGRAHLDRAVRPYFRRAPALHQPFVAMMRREPMPMGQMEVGNEALVTASSVLLRGLAAEKPTLWIFDDLHDAPEAALRHFEAMARIAPTGPILLIATARPGLPDQVPERLARTERFTRMMLQPLQPDAVEAILREAVGDELRAEQLATPIAVKSGGNPYFLFSILAALRTEGSLSGSGALERIVIPSEIRDLVGSRLRDLSRAERMVLDAAAVQGMRFDADLIASVLEQPVIGVLQDLAEMERQRGIVRASGRLYRFGHNLLQEVVYEEIPARLCGEYHMRLAEVRAAASAGEPAGDDAPFLAHHYLRGVEPERALPYLTAALDHAQSRYLHEIGLDLIDRALQLEDLPESERLELLFRRVRCLGLLERREAERAAITDVTQLAEKLGDPALRARAWIELAHWLQVAGREPEALEAVQRASELAELSGDRGLLARIVSRLGTALARLRRIDEAVVQHERAYGIAREIGDLEAESHAAHSLGSVLRMLNRYDEASAKYERVLEIGADEHSRHIRGSLGVLRTHQGRWEDAERELRRQIKLARRYGERRQESQGTGNLGLCLTMAGRLGDARKLLERYSLFCSELAYRRSVAVAAIAQAQLEFFSGNLVLAHEHADEGHRRALEAHAPQLVAAGLHLLGRVHLAEGRADDAVTGFSESAAAYRSIGDRDRTTEALIDQAEAESARGDDERAHFLLNEAIEIAEGLPTPPRLIVALASRANLIGAGEDADRARTLLESGADRMAAYDRIRAEWLLFQATGEAALRAAARADLDRLIDSARPADRDGMRERPPLYAAVSQCT